MRKETDNRSPSTVFEGMTSIRAVLSRSGTNDRKIIRVLCDAARTDARRKDLSYLESVAGENGFDIVMTDGDTLDRMTTGNTHGGIIAECSARTIPSLDELKTTEKGFYVMLEGIEDPYNFGYAIRSVWAAGADGIILPGRNWMTAAGVVCRSSAGASEMIDLFVTADGFEACKFFKKQGYRIACAGIRDAVSMYDADLRKPIFLVVGGEKRGISRGVLDEADSVVKIDYGRPFRGSLSAASAATVLAYEVLRQNR